MSETPKIAFIGAGNMAGSIIGGLIANGYPADAIIASDPNDEGLASLSNATGVGVTTNNATAVENAQVVVLAVKPQIMQVVCESLVDYLPSATLVISIAAGITSKSLKQWLRSDRNKKVPIVRCMPNTPALVQAGASALYANKSVTAEQKQQAQTILGAVGTICWVDEESAIDAATAVSGSGPAYFFLLIEAMTEAGVKLGLPQQTAASLATQTAFGAAKLARESDVDAAELRRRVTSPNGTTHEAITSFERNHFRDIVDQAMTACADRSRELAKELG